MALDKSKTDPELGHRVQEHLKNLGVDTPSILSTLSTTPKERINAIAANMQLILADIGFKLDDDSMCETPKRLAKMWINDLTWGLDPTNFPKCTAVDNKMKYDEMVIVKDINVMSLCEHHLATIDGTAHVAYIPDKKVIGLSKLPRVVEYFSRRPQIQERLTEQIYHALQLVLETDAIAVTINATHYCVKARGIGDQNSTTTTSKLGGAFKINDALRKEYMDLIK